MELLQNLTLYDLLGYTLPGCIFLVIWKQEDLQQVSEIGTAGVILILAVGFLAGIMISEIMQWLEKLCFTICKQRQWKKVCEAYALTEKRMRKALQNAGIISAQSDKSEEAEVDCARYYTAMFADIQADPRYSRIHNYASAALLYRNMMLPSIVCFFAGWCRGSQEQKVVGLLALVCFLLRWARFIKKKTGYAVCWFIEKYDCVE